MASKSGRVSKANFADMRATDKLGKRISTVDKFVPPDIKLNLKTAGIDREKMKKAMAPRVRPKGARGAKPTRKKTDIFALIDHGIEMDATEEAKAKLAAEKAARDAPIPDLLVKPKPKEPVKPKTASIPESKPAPTPAPKAKDLGKPPKQASKILELELEKPVKSSKSKKTPKRSKSTEIPDELKKNKRISVRNLPPKRNKSVDVDLFADKKKERKARKSKSIELGDDDRSKKSKKKKEKRRSTDSYSKSSKKKGKRKSVRSRESSFDSKSDISLQSLKSSDHSQPSLHDSVPDFDAINAIKERRKKERGNKEEPKAEPIIDSFFDTPSSKDAKELKNEIDTVNDQIDDSEKQKQNELVKLKKEFDAKKKELDKEFGPQIEEIKGQIAKSARTNENLQSGAQKIIEKLRGENKKLRAEAEKYPPQILELRQKNYNLEKTNKNVAYTHDGLKKMAKKLEADHEKLHAQNEKCRDEYLPKYRSELRMRQKHIETEQEIKEVYRETAVKIANRVTQTRDADLIETITDMIIDIEGELNPKFDPMILFADESDDSDDDSGDDSDSDSD
ncbi:MAG: hypothetical protein SGBAC_011700 [Bacillariaceae sp.]